MWILGKRSQARLRNVRADRRHQARPPRKVKVVSSDFGGKAGYTLDLTDLGALIQSPVPVNDGHELELCLELYPGHMGIQVGGVTRWCDPSRGLVGVEFLSISCNGRRQLTALSSLAC